MNKIEEIFDNQCKSEMKSWNIEEFKKTHPTLHQAIINSMKRYHNECLEDSKPKAEQTEAEFYSRLDEIVSRFPNGIDRFRTSPTFNRVVTMLARGASEYNVIEQLCVISEDSQKALGEYMLRAPMPNPFKRG